LFQWLYKALCFIQYVGVRNGTAIRLRPVVAPEATGSAVGHAALASGVLDVLVLPFDQQRQRTGKVRSIGVGRIGLIRHGIHPSRTSQA
jgi:hypothetical protein